MIKRVTQNYKVVCDHCGKEEFVDEYQKVKMGIHHILFATTEKTIRDGNLCNECYAEFLELAENFFDDVNWNRRADNEQREAD